MKGLSFNFLSEYFPLFIEGLLWTLLIALLAVIFGVILGSILCFMKKSKFIILRAIANIYIEIVRGTPVLLQVYCLLWINSFWNKARCIYISNYCIIS